MVSTTPRVQRITDGQRLSEVLAAIWHEVAPYRSAIHYSTCTDRCDLRIGSGRFHLDGNCACRDFMVDMLVECHRYLARVGQLNNPMGAVRVHMRMRAADWNRRRRVEMGAQSRADRVRRCIRARALPDDFHRALLEYLVDEAGLMAPLENDHDLTRKLAVRCTKEFGGAPEDYLARVTEGVAVVERHCRSGPKVNAGTPECPEPITWWERYVERPLGRRPRRSVLPIDAVPGAALATAGSSETDMQAVAILMRALRRRPEAPATALGDGISDLVAHGLLSRQSAVALFSDHARFALAAQELSTLGRRIA